MASPDKEAVVGRLERTSRRRFSRAEVGRVRRLTSALLGGAIVMRRATRAPRGATATRSVTVGKPAEELWRAFRDPATLGAVLDGLARAEMDGETIRIVVDVPSGALDWHATIVEERAGDLLRWRSLDGELFDAECTVRFRPASADRGTVVSLSIRLEPRAGTLRALAARWIEEAEHLIEEKILRRFKSLAETGEFPQLKRNPSARVDPVREVRAGIVLVGDAPST